MVDPVNLTFNPMANAIQLMSAFGLFSVVLPMLLIFVVFYAILLKTKILGDSEQSHVKGICAIISFVAAFLVITSTQIVTVLNNLIQQSALLLVIVMLILMVLAFLGFKTETTFGAPKAWAWVFVGVIIFIFLCIIDASGFAIPGIHQIVQAATGATGVPEVAWNDQMTSILIAIALFIALPLIVIGVIVWKND